MPEAAPTFNTSFEQLPEQLRTLAELGLSNARRELERRGRINPSVTMLRADGEIVPFRLTDELSAFFFGDSGKKQIFFSVLREAVKKYDVTSVIMVTDIWGGKPTEKMKGLTREDALCLIKKTASLDNMVKQGWMTRTEAILVNIQTEEYFAMVQQEYIRDSAARRVIWLDRNAGLYPQEDFDGSAKMYGKHNA